MRIARRFFLSLAGFLLAGALCAEPVSVPPTWYPDHSFDYPEKEYLAFLGEGTDNETARNDAMQQMANYFGVDVKSVSSGSQSYREITAGGTTSSKLESSISNKIQIKSSQKLFTVKTTAFYQLKSDRVLVLAYLNRDAGLSAWDEIERTTILLFESSKSRVSNANLPMGTRLAHFQVAQLLARQISDYELKRSLLKEGAPVLFDSHLRDEWAALKDGFLPLSAISISVSGDDSEAITAQLAGRLSEAGFLTGTGGGALVLSARSAIKETGSGYGLAAFQWKLDLSLSDGTLTVATLGLQGKSSGSSSSKAREKLENDIRSQIETNFVPEMINRLLKPLE